MVKALISTLLALLLMVSTTHAVDENDSNGSVIIAEILNRMNGPIDELNSERKKLRKLTKSLSSKKQARAEKLITSAVNVHKNLKKLRRQLSKLQNKVLKEEILGEPSKKSIKKYNRLAKDINSKLIGADSTSTKISQFIINNEVSTANFRGAWNTNFGRIVFAQFDDNFVTGTYNYNGGGIAKGTVDKRVLVGTYTGNNGGTGTFAIKMSKNGNSWGGRYKTSDGTGGGRWSASKAN